MMLLGFRGLTGLEIRKLSNQKKHRTMIDWDKVYDRLTKAELELIGKIIDRAERESYFHVDRHHHTMNLECVHALDTPLDLQKMLDAPRADFGHDFWGINRHLNRQTDKLEGLFLPRCAKPESEICSE